MQLCSHRQAVDTPRHTRKHARTAWYQPLTHHARRDSHENQRVPPAEESTSSHASIFRSASDKAKVGLLRCAFHSFWLSQISSRKIRHNTCHPLALASLIFQSVLALLLPLGLRDFLVHLHEPAVQVLPFRSLDALVKSLTNNPRPRAVPPSAGLHFGGVDERPLSTFFTWARPL